MRALAVILLLLSPVALAQRASSTPLTLSRALELSPANDPEVIAAQADLVAAQQALSRQLADPLALTVGDLEAESTTEAAQAALASARLTNRSETSSLFFAVLSAEVSKALAARKLALERSSYQAAQIRAEVGAASGLELLQAENSFAAAQRQQAAADEASLLAYRELADAVGLSTTELLLRGLAQLPATTPTAPTLADSLARAQRENTDVAAARTAVRLAQAQLTASDTIFSAQVDVEATEDEVTRTQSDLEATLRQLTLSVRSAHSDLVSAIRTLTEARATRQAYAQELEAQRTRLQAGAISQSEFGEVEVTDLENAQAVQRALYDVQLSRLALEGAIVGSGLATGGTAVEGDVGTPATSEDESLSGSSDPETDAADDSATSDTLEGTDDAAEDSGDENSDAAAEGTIDDSSGTDEVAPDTDAGSDDGGGETGDTAPPDEGDEGAPTSP